MQKKYTFSFSSVGLSDYMSLFFKFNMLLNTVGRLN